MSAEPDWTSPWRHNRRIDDLKKIREGMWPTIFFASASSGGFVLSWDCTASNQNTHEQNTFRRFESNFNFSQAEIDWNFDPGGVLISVDFRWRLDAILLPTIPGTVTFNYENFLHPDSITSYTWS